MLSLLLFFDCLTDRTASILVEWGLSVSCWSECVFRLLQTDT